MRAPKYSLAEFERRFLVLRTPDLTGATCRTIEDHYIEGTRMRLRAVAGALDGDVEYKLCKKYPSESRSVRPIVNIYLSAEEHALLARLPGRRLRKRRYRLAWRNRDFGVDVFDGELLGLVLTEFEASSEVELAGVSPPPWCEAEVTADAFFDGDRLARLTAAELQARLSG